MPPLPGIYPDYAAPIVRNSAAGRELTMARWGMPSPASVLVGKKSDSGVTNVRNVESAHWRRWLGAENRCVVPFTSFSENEVLPDGKRPTVWFALDETRPLAFFAGIWTRWTSVRKVKEGETTNDLFAILTTDAQCRGRRHSSEGDAGHPARAGGGRALAQRPDAGRAEAATTAARRRTEDRGARREGRRRAAGHDEAAGAAASGELILGERRILRGVHSGNFTAERLRSSARYASRYGSRAIRSNSNSKKPSTSTSRM